MKRLPAFLGAALLALCFGAGQAAADGGGEAAQGAGQSATSGQDAGGKSGAYQSGPSNSATSIRVLSPGSGGDVSQSNTVTSGAVAANDNDTNQSIDQSQAGSGPGSDSTQIAGQSAGNEQQAEADSKAVQVKPSNEALSIRVLSPGGDGDLTQSNSATAGAVALNDNDTKQTVDQTQAGGGYGSDATQIAGQDSANRQHADADATAVQVKPSNDALSIRVLSPGDDGNVTQSNDATALGVAANDNKTKQSIDQTQGGLMPKKEVEHGKPAHGKPGYGSDSTQIAGQSASSYQKAEADATAVQVKPSNTATSIRVLSPGDDGNVTQSNDATALAVAANENTTKQSIDQDQAGRGHGSDYVQIAGQQAGNRQSADADAFALQVKPSNANESTRVLSPGDGGDVSQSNGTTAIAGALNGNHTYQSVDQSQVGGGYGAGYLQVAGQGSWSKQHADAAAVAIQLGASNENAPVRVGSRGGGGSVEQSNDVTAVAVAINHVKTKQALTQTQAGYGSKNLQVAGQGSWSEQRGSAMALALQGGMRKHKR